MYQSKEEAEIQELDTVLQSAKVLLIDDNLELLEILGQILSGNGYDVHPVERGTAALDYLQYHTPDIIICDVMLPEQNGFELHQEIRKNPEWYNIPFVFLTALAGDENVRMGKQLGCDDYLTKPFDPDDLLAVVKGKLTLSAHRKKMVGDEYDGYRRRIIHTLSHEFRTPLVSINTGAELLLDQHTDLGEEQVHRLLQSVLRGGQRLERLVDDFMLLQQIDLGHAEHTCQLYRSDISLIRLVEASLDSFRESRTEREFSEPESLFPSSNGDARLMTNVYDVQVINVIQRLLSNAYKFGGAKGKVTVSSGQKDGKGFISIRDRGPGLNKKKSVSGEVYESFNQLNRETYEQQGCGLGLTISRYFIEINGGELFLLDPEDGVGLDAVIAFPLVDDLSN